MQRTLNALKTHIATLGTTPKFYTRREALAYEAHLMTTLMIVWGSAGFVMAMLVLG
jgi:hypothetical protein